MTLTITGAVIWAVSKYVLAFVGGAVAMLLFLIACFEPWR